MKPKTIFCCCCEVQRNLTQFIDLLKTLLKKCLQRYSQLKELAI